MGKASVYKSEGSIINQDIRNNVKLSAMNRQGIQNVSINSGGSATKGLAPLNDKSKLSKIGGQIIGSLAFSHNQDFISSGTISSDSNSGNSTISKSYLHLVPEGSAGTDTLNNITGRKFEGQIMILTNALSGSTITLTHTATGDGQFTCPDATDYDLVYPNAVMIIDDPTQTPYQTWKVIGPAPSTSVADNLGNHIATTDLDMSNNTIIDFNGLDQQNANTTGAINLVNNSSIRWKDTAGTGEGIFRLNNLDNFSFTHSIDMSSKNITAIEKAVFSNSGIPSAGEVAIGAITGDMYFEALSNDSFYFRINGTTQVEIDEDGLDIRNGWLELEERTAPTGLSNHTRLYAKDNGSGKTQLVVIFGSGVEQVIATEP